MRLIFLGAPGTGKGTQAGAIADQYNIPQVATGDILRRAVKEGTELGQKAKTIMDRGELVPDQIILDLIKSRLSEPDCENGYILDGFPRTLDQAEGLDRMMDGDAVDAVIYFDMPQDEIIERVTSRRVCVSCGKTFNMINNPPPEDKVCPRCGGDIIQRDDDKEETVRKRLVVYKEKTAPLVNYYRERGRLLTIDASGTVDAVRKEIESKVETLNA
jgi:adenylate kinase